MRRMEAHAALDAVQHSERWLAQRGWPLSRHVAFGALEGLIVASWGFAQPWAGLAAVAALGGLFGIMKFDRDRDGFFISGWSTKAARPATVLAVLAVVAGFVAMSLTGPTFEWRPEGLAIGAAVAVACTAASLWWERLWRRDLMAGFHG